MLRTSSFAAQVAAARAGVCVMLAAEPFATLEGLCRVPLGGAAKRAVEETIFLVGHQALRRVPRVAVVWTFLRERMEAAR